MPLPRRSLIDVSRTPYYHCVSRCVRRAFLCGKDVVTGRSYEHRRQWVEERLLLLGEVFSIHICAYAVMHNHTHLVLHIDAGQAQRLSNEEVLTRWHRLHKGTACEHDYSNPSLHDQLSPADKESVRHAVAVYRRRLADISWFMRELNEYIARQANKEDECTGRFWEGRYKSQALLDHTALAACMAYVDSNPIRAGIAKTLQASRHTSIYQRLRRTNTARVLSQFSCTASTGKRPVLPFSWQAYATLLDTTVAVNQAGTHKRSPSLCQASPCSSPLDPIWNNQASTIEKQFGNSVSTTLLRKRLHRRAHTASSLTG